MKKDFEDGRSYSPNAGDKVIAAKTKTWNNNFLKSMDAQGRKADAATGPQFDTSTSGNRPTSPFNTGPQQTSAAALDAALKTIFGLGGGEPGEGFHPSGSN